MLKRIIEDEGQYQFRLAEDHIVVDVGSIGRAPQIVSMPYGKELDEAKVYEKAREIGLYPDDDTIYYAVGPCGKCTGSADYPVNFYV